MEYQPFRIAAKGRARAAPISDSVAARAAFALLLMGFALGAQAASIYRCVDPNGRLAFRDTPCAPHARQTKMDPTGLPLIDAAASHDRASRRGRGPSGRPRTRYSRTRHPRTRRHRRTRPTSWECRAADGEVFYRHTRCPGSVPGDGVVRSRYAAEKPSGRTRGRHGAWSRVPVHGVQIPRDEACRRIHSAGAAVRDGHRRDAHVSTYDHLMGRDPCLRG